MTGNVSYPLCVEWTTEIPYEDTPRRSPDISFLESEWFLKLCLTQSSYSGDDYYLYLFNKKDKNFKEGITITTGIQNALKYTTPTLISTRTVEKSDDYLWVSTVKDISKSIPNIFSTGKFTIICVFHSVEPDVEKTQVLKLNSSGTPSGPTVSDDLQSLSRDFTTFLEDETFSDVQLQCGDRTFSAHRSVLAARSEVFAAMFRNKMAERDTGVVDVQDVDSEVLELLLRYVYSGKRPDLGEGIARRLYEAADKYAVHALKKTCSEWMVEELTSDNGLEVLVLADEHSDENLKDGVARFVAENLHMHGRESWSTFKEAHPQLAIKVYDMRFADALSD